MKKRNILGVLLLLLFSLGVFLPSADALGISIAADEYAYFGRYLHKTGTNGGTNDPDGQKPILWRMLSDDRLWSVYLVDKQQWNPEGNPMNDQHWTGANDNGLSTLRPWLNNTTPGSGFTGDAFTTAEQAYLNESVDGDTDAKVTILETSTLPGNPGSDIRKGAYLGQDTTYSDYWTRTPLDTFSVWAVDADGYENVLPASFILGVRPALNLKSSSLIFKSGSDSSPSAAAGGEFLNPYFLYLPTGTVTPAPLTVDSTTAFIDELTIKFTTSGTYSGQIYHAHSGASASESDLAGKFLVGGTAPTNALVSRDSVILTLANPIAPGDTPMVAYTATNDTDTDAIGYVTPAPGLVPTTLGAVSIAGTDVAIKPYLTDLTISSGTLAFDKKTLTYPVNVANSVASVTLTPTAAGTGATITVDGANVSSGSASGSIALSPGQAKAIAVVLTTAGENTTYTVTVTRATGGSNPDPVDPPQPSTVTTPGKISVTIGGKTYEAEKQTDGTYLIVLPHGTDLTNVPVNVTPPKGGSVSPDLSKGADFSKGPIKFTITAEDKKTTKEYTLEIVTENAPGPDVESGSIAGTDISRWLVFAAYNADGTIAVEIRIPLAPGFDIANLDKLYALLSGLTNLSFACVDADGNVVPITSRTAGEPYLRITGTAASKAALASTTLSRLSYWLKADATEYRQTFAQALKLSDAQVTYTNNPPSTGGGEEEEKGGSGGGCDAGFGALALVFSAAALRKRGRLG